MGLRAALGSVGFRSRVLITIICLLLGLLGGQGGTNRGRFSLDLSLKTPLGRNKVVRLGLFWIVFRIQALRLHLVQLIYAKFLFLFSLRITCLFLFLLLGAIDLVYV